eukprot:TRINITY_DN26823_c0_g1_i1.p1 TRINITY_DN26823_c0_g1~~TRINITY_DN26823_c0_g1_i1.p1  ORF type:complete len:104 (+),score=2.32 TRINITY_DN26823_c0_g1_i1:159-470(+)
MILKNIKTKEKEVFYKPVKGVLNPKFLRFRLIFDYIKRLLFQRTRFFIRFMMDDFFSDLCGFLRKDLAFIKKYSCSPFILLRCAKVYADIIAFLFWYIPEAGW